MDKQKHPREMAVYQALSLITFTIVMLIYTDRFGEFGLNGSLPCLAAFFIMTYLQAALHEAGHLAFGLATGYRFCSYRVGSLILLKRNGKLLLRRSSLPGTLGQCLMVPPEMNHGKIPYRLYNLGGPLMDLISAAVCALAAALCKSNPVVNGILLALSLWMLNSALCNGIPLRLGLINNDGRNALDMGRDPIALRAFWAQLKYCEAQAEGRIPEMPDEWFILPEDADMRNPLIAELRFLDCDRGFGRASLAESEARMTELLEFGDSLVGANRLSLINDLVFCELIGENRAERLSELADAQTLKQLKRFRNLPAYQRTQYARTLLAEQNREKATELRAQFDRRFRHYAYPEEIALNRALMDLADQKAA